MYVTGLREVGGRGQNTTPCSKSATFSSSSAPPPISPDTGVDKQLIVLPEETLKKVVELRLILRI